MTPEEHKLLEQTYELTKQNNEMLAYVKRHAQVGTVVKVIYWSVIILLSLGALVAIKPYMEFLKGVSGNGSLVTPGVGISQQIQELLQ